MASSVGLFGLRMGELFASPLPRDHSVLVGYCDIQVASWSLKRRPLGVGCLREGGTSMDFGTGRLPGDWRVGALVVVDGV